MVLLKVANFEALPGHGISVAIDDNILLLGNKKIMMTHHIDLSKLEEDSNRLAEEGKTPMYIAIDNHLAGISAVADTLKESSEAAIRKLRKMGIAVVMMIGDNKRTAEAISRQVGIDRVLSDVLPEEKASQVELLQNEGKKVAMVGTVLMMRRHWHKLILELRLEQERMWQLNQRISY